LELTVRGLLNELNEDSAGFGEFLDGDSGGVEKPLRTRGENKAGDCIVVGDVCFRGVCGSGQSGCAFFSALDDVSAAAAVAVTTLGGSCKGVAPDVCLLFFATTRC
jgi:hypothetical protein